ncbi:hypothetical protein [Oceanospirillum beijerinckii]|uniref:hypothetical protein n=1 Tax=Oceanospirillum beijerinckii TaxID=64976 RepID=UPI000429C869|nr:hypothetical protein [Oceanospirillum beijerinckii]
MKLRPLDISGHYSDSANDLPLLQWADEAFVVSPEASLAQIAQEKQWPILHWS